MSKILLNRSGASMIFVLGIMLMLMAIGVSVLVAASTNNNIKLSQKEHNQIMILSDAVHNNIMYSLQHDTENENLLSYKIIMALCKANDAGLITNEDELGISSLDLEMEMENESEFNTGDITVEKITLSFPVDGDGKNSGVRITAPKSAIWTPIYNEETGDIIQAEGIRDRPREPKTAEVNITMMVTVEISINDEISVAGKKAVTRAVYTYKGGKLTDDPDGAYSGKTDDAGEHYDDNFYGHEFHFEAGKYGEWEMIKYEKLDS